MMDQQPDTISQRKDWRQKRTIRLLNISASQAETFDLCTRKWWFDVVRKLPRGPSKHSQVWGTVLHSVVERYLSADDLGNDPKTGAPVDLYPPNWYVAAGRWGQPSEGSIDPDEQVLLRRLIDAAIEQGVLVREQHRKIEYEFVLPVLVDQKCPRCNGRCGWDDDSGWVKCPDCKVNDEISNGKGTTVMLRGFMDQVTPTAIDDHKTLKNMRYALSPAKLAKNVQALAYAYKLLQMYFETKATPPDKIELRHNQYCKDPNDLRVRKTIATVTREEVERSWLEMQNRAHRMVKIRRADRHTDIPDPDFRERPCQAYGGCQYATICCGQESEEGYETRLDKWNENNKLTLESTVVSATEIKDTPLQETPIMAALDFAEIMAAQMAAKTASGTAGPAPAAAVGVGAAPITTPTVAVTPTPPVNAPPATPAPVVQAPVVTTPPPAVAAAGGTLSTQYPPPPWANPACKACGGLGFNTRFNPCRTCHTVAKTEGKPAPLGVDPSDPTKLVSDTGDYIITPTSKGTSVWALKADDEICGESALTRNLPAEIKVEEKTAAPVAAPATVEASAPVVTPTPVATSGFIQVEAPVKTGTIPTVQELPTATPADKPEKTSKKGRPKQGFILAINCAIIEGDDRKGSGRYMYRLEDILADLHRYALQQYNAENPTAPKESAYDLDYFKRQDCIRKATPMYVEQMDIGIDMIVATGVPNMPSDERTLVTALRAIAQSVICATND